MEFLPVLLICSALAGGIGGFLAGMIGVGAGLIAVPLLFYLFMWGDHVPAVVAMHCAVATTMGGLVFNALATVVAHYRMGNVQWVAFGCMIGFCMVGVILGVLTASYLPGQILQMVFGILMIILSIKMIMETVIKKSRSVASKKVSANSSWGWGESLLGGSSIGYYTGIFGLANVLLVPFLHRKFTMPQSVGTAMMLSVCMLPFGIGSYMVAGLEKAHFSAPWFIGYVHWPAMLAVGLPGMFTAPLGAMLAQRAPQTLLKALFASATLIIGGKMLIT